MTNLAEFIEALDGCPNVQDIDLAGTTINDGSAPYIILRHADHVVILCAMALGEHLCVDVHSFIGGERATAGVFGMTQGRRFELAESGTTSHGWNSASLVSVLLGKQEEGK